MNHYSLAKANDEKKSASFRKDVEDSFLLYPKMRVSIKFHIMGYLENFWYKASYQSTNHLEKFSTECRKKSGIALLFFKFTL